MNPNIPGPCWGETHREVPEGSPEWTPGIPGRCRSQTLAIFLKRVSRCPCSPLMPLVHFTTSFFMQLRVSLFPKRCARTVVQSLHPGCRKRTAICPVLLPRDRFHRYRSVRNQYTGNFSRSCSKTIHACSSRRCCGSDTPGRCT
jgi:hypothetical protein